MFGILIADDEPKIRRGLCEAFEWENLNMKVVGAAKDGEEALQLARREKPDICLVDICMPIINGLELVEKLKEENPNVIIILITGYDEFSYAKEAVKLGVFDYVLKPVAEDELLKILEKAKNLLEERLEKEKRFDWADSQLKKNSLILRDRFILSWLYGDMPKDDITEQLRFYQMDFGEKIGVTLVKINGLNTASEILRTDKEKKLIFSEVYNVLEGILELLDLYPFFIVRDESEGLVSVSSLNDYKKWKRLASLIEDKVYFVLNQRVTVYQEAVEGRPEELHGAYERVKKNAINDLSYLPIIQKTKLYIENNYADPELSLSKIALELGVSSGNLSKLFKQETDISYIDYLTQIRIREAMKLMDEPSARIYEVAEQVGYSSQHYFCAAFKREVGIAPSAYRKKPVIIES
jgi:two-component system, response regulator YesN